MTCNTCRSIYLAANNRCPKCSGESRKPRVTNHASKPVFRAYWTEDEQRELLAESERQMAASRAKKAAKRAQVFNRQTGAVPQQKPAEVPSPGRLRAKSPYAGFWRGN